MQLVICPAGEIRCLYAEAIDLHGLGSLSIRRASHVEPTSDGRWFADLFLIGGPRLGPFDDRTQALSAEQDWLVRNWLLVPR